MIQHSSNRKFRDHPQVSLQSTCPIVLPTPPLLFHYLFEFVCCVFILKFESSITLRTIDPKRDLIVIYLLKIRAKSTRKKGKQKRINTIGLNEQ